MRNFYHQESNIISILYNIIMYEVTKRIKNHDYAKQILEITEVLTLNEEYI